MAGLDVFEMRILEKNEWLLTFISVYLLSSGLTQLVNEKNSKVCFQKICIIREKSLQVENKNLKTMNLNPCLQPIL